MVQRIKKWICLFGVGILCLTGCGGVDKEIEQDGQETISPSTEANNETQGQLSQLRLSMQNPSTLHPIYNMDKSVQQNLNLIFDTLVTIEEDGSIRPNIAESWVYLPEENSLTLRIQEDIKWHDGEALTANDVVFSVETIKKATQSPYKLSVANVANIQALDAQTVQIAYRQPFSGAFQSLFFPVIPAHIYDQPESVSSTLDPVGSGPYRYERYTLYKDLTLTANDAYFKGKPQIETITVMITPDQKSALDAFEQKLIDVIYTDVMDWGKYANNKSSHIYEIRSQYYEFMGVNFNKPLFQNENIRMILLLGIDRESLLGRHYLGHGTVTDTPISPTSYLYDKTLQIKQYDKERAKLLLGQEGYVYDKDKKLFTKNGLPLSFKLLVNAENSDRVGVAKTMQAMYKELGIELVIEEVDKVTYAERVYNKQYEAFLGGWRLSYIPDLSFAFHSSQIQKGDNFVSYQDEQMDTLLSQAYNATPYMIEEAYAALQHYIAQQNPYISLYFRNGALIAGNNITGIENPSPLNVYQNIHEWELED